MAAKRLIFAMLASSLCSAVIATTSAGKIIYCQLVMWWDQIPNDHGRKIFSMTPRLPHLSTPGLEAIRPWGKKKKRSQIGF